MSFQHHLLTQTYNDFNCPICQQVIIQSQCVMHQQHCSHLLFVALDLGFEYITDQFEQSLPFSVDELHNQDKIYILQSVIKSSIQNFQVIQFPLGVADLSRYLGFAD